MKKIILPLVLLTIAALFFLGKGNTPADQNAGSGEAMIGGAFTLTDQNGKEVKDTDFRGRLMLVFFGFTHCPDICPVTSKNFSEMMSKLEGKGDQVVPIFISVDPERDTPAVLKDYFSNFDSRIVALTGTAEQTKEAASAYKVYYSKKEPEGEHAHHGGGYMVDHSGYVYLMDRNGKYVKHFQYDASPEMLIEALKPYLK